MLIKFEIKIELFVIWIFLNRRGRKIVLDIVRGERRLTKNTHDFENGPADFEFMLNDAVGDDSNMSLNMHSILGFSTKLFNLQMLLEPLEEQFELQTYPVKVQNILCVLYFVSREIQLPFVRIAKLTKSFSAFDSAFSP